jgi:hypothetical protein
LKHEEGCAWHHVPFVSMRVWAKLEIAQCDLCRARVVGCWW